MHTFHERLLKVSEQNDSLLCVGLDPEPSFGGVFDPGVVLGFNEAIIESTFKFACAYNAKSSYL